VPDLQEIQKEWPVISGAPWLFAGAVLVAAMLIWLFLWIIHRSQIAGKNSTIQAREAQLESQTAGLKEQIGIVEQRLKLASEKAEIASVANVELEKRFQAYEAQVGAKADYASLSALAEKVEAAMRDAAAANNAVSSTLSATLHTTDVQDVASFSVDAGEYGAVKDMGGLGGKNLNPEIIKYLQDVGKSPGTTLNSLPDGWEKSFK
jgi:hypothetical protein